MRVRMIAMAAGPDGAYAPGKEFDVPEPFGQDLVAGRYAEAVTPPVKAPAPETAQVAPPETAMLPRAKPRKGA